MTQQVKQGDTVKVHYRAFSNDGIIFDSSAQPEPLQLTVGKSEVIPAFEKALIGMEAGEKKSIKIASEEAFGPRLEELITKVPKSQIPKDVKLTTGQFIQIQQPDGEIFLAKVIAQDDDHITFDANHPLAGKDITFDIHLIEII